MKPEEKARQKIDQLLQDAGWEVQDHKDLNLGASLGVAVREFPVSTGYADYMLFVDRKAAGVIEAKPEGTTLTSAEYQSDKYLCSLSPDLPCFQNPLPFAYESTEIETFFRNLKDPDTKSRRLFAFHTPGTLLEWASDEDSIRKASRESISYERQDFWATTSNKQLNFVQHVKTLLKMHGKAGIVVPDNVLFEGGAGETVRRKLLHECDVHTLLRLPTGVFYAQGVKANVLFFDRKPASKTPWTQKLWIYDLRTNMHFTLKENTLGVKDLEDFVKCYNPTNRHKRKETDRFHSFTYDELMQRDKVNLDIFWIKDESLEDAENLPEPSVLAAEIIENLEAALDQFRGVVEGLEKQQ